MYNNSDKQNNLAATSTKSKKPLPRTLVNENYIEPAGNEAYRIDEIKEQTTPHSATPILPEAYNNDLYENYYDAVSEHFYETIDEPYNDAVGKVKESMSNTYIKFQTDDLGEPDSLTDIEHVWQETRSNQLDNQSINREEIHTEVEEVVGVNEIKYEDKNISIRSYEVPEARNNSATLPAQENNLSASLKQKINNYLQDIIKLGNQIQNYSKEELQKITDFVSSLINQTKSFFTEKNLGYNETYTLDISKENIPDAKPISKDRKNYEVVIAEGPVECLKFTSLSEEGELRESAKWAKVEGTSPMAALDSLLTTNLPVDNSEASKNVAERTASVTPEIQDEIREIMRDSSMHLQSAEGGELSSSQATLPVKEQNSLSR